MKFILCSDVQEWLTSLNNHSKLAIPPIELCEHIASCVTCRAFVLLLSAELLHAPLHTKPISCDQCQQDLAVYADIARDEGQEIAVRDYPYVWWHLWVCADCADIYHALLTLQEEEHISKQHSVLHPHMPLAQASLTAPRAFVAAFSLPRIWLSRVLMPQLATSWGNTIGDTVIHDVEHEEYRVSVVMRRNNDQWTMMITVDPSIVGDIVLNIGEASFRQTLGPDGTATIDALPPDLLLDPAGPGVVIVLEAAE